MTSLSFAIRSALFVTLVLASSTGHAQTSDPIFNIVYLEVAPETISQTLTILSVEAREGHKHAGNRGFVALQRDGLPTEFMILSLWKDQSSLSSYIRSSSASAKRRELSRNLIGPLDERVNVAVLVDEGRTRAALAAPDSHMRFAVTHIDLIPETLDEGIRAARVMVKRSTTQPGSLAFDLLNQASRSNHFASLGIWQTPEDLVQYKNQAFVRQFREHLPLTGCVYDERIYHAIP